MQPIGSSLRKRISLILVEFNCSIGWFAFSSPVSTQCVYSISIVILWRPSVVRPLVCCPPILNIFFSKIASPIKPIKAILRGASMGMETKVCVNGAGHVTKISVTPIYGIFFLQSFIFRTRRPMIFKLEMVTVGKPWHIYGKVKI